MLAKISSLPQDIRHQLNLRLANSEPASTLLPWLNSLPEVQAHLADHFGGNAINEVNLSDYRRTAFRRWEMRQAALEFVSEDPDETPSATRAAQASPLVDHLVHWIATRFAAAAQTAPLPATPEADLRELRNYLSDIVALRRGDLVARRLALEQQRLALEQAKAQPQQEKLFWEWTKRPDIQPKLYPHRDSHETRLSVQRVLDETLLGARPSAEIPDPQPDPACLV